MSQLISERTAFEQTYQLDFCIKSGRLSSLYECRHRLNGHKCILKIIDFSKLSNCDFSSLNEALKEENERYHKLVHKHVAQLYDSYIFSDGILFLVFEHIEGNDLLVEIVKRANAGYVYSENVISYYMKQIMDAIAACHKADIIHGNIKPENILMASDNNCAPVKLCGFGRSIIQDKLEHKSALLYYEQNNLFDSLPNTYIAPELTKDHCLFTKASDIYSCGILLLTLLCGSALNFDKEIEFFSIEEKIWNNVSDIAKELVLRMLNPNPHSRITADEALKHKWLCQKDIFAPKIHLINTIEEMRRYNIIRTIKKNIATICFSEKLNQQNINFRFDDKDYALLVGVFEVIKALDKITSLSSINSRQDFIMNLLLEDNKLVKFLEIFDFVSKSIKEWKTSIPESSAFDIYEEGLQVLESLPQSSSPYTKVQDLLNILYSPYLQLLLRTQDIVSEILVNHKPMSGSSSVDSNLNQLENSHSSYEMDDNITPLRLVQFQKNSNEPMGITLKLDECGRCIVSRIMHGGMIHRQATLHVGDVICEINDIPVSNQSVDSLQRLLRDAKGNVSFKILPTSRLPPAQCEIYVRAQFNYNPKDDELIPSAEAGLIFNTGDILEIICKEDYYWWQSRREGDKGSAGLIPSLELVEWRATHKVAQKCRKDRQNCMIFGKKKKYRDKYSKRNALFDQLDIASYEEVVYFSSFKRKSLVLLGAHGIGRRHIKNTLISNYPAEYAYPIPHTTRFPRKGEENGKHYFFVSQEVMLEEISNNEYLEYGTHEDAMYGTKIDTIKQIIRDGKIAILDVEPQALKILRTAEFAPFVVYIAAPSLMNIQDTDGSLQRLTRESEFLQKAYCHLFDLSIINNDIEETVKLVEKAFKHINSCPQWIPCNWIY